MRGFAWEGGGPGNPNLPRDDPAEHGEFPSDNTLFDASRYAFFGKEVVEEVELGGLGDEDGDSAGFSRIGEEYPFPTIQEREEVIPFRLNDVHEDEGLCSLSDTDDLASTFAKLNRYVNEPRSPGVIGDRGSCSRESSSTAEWTQDGDYSSWIDQRILDAENIQEGKRWWSQPRPSSSRLSEYKPLYRASSYPQQQQQQQLLEEYSRKALRAPNSFFTSYAPGARPQPLSNLTRHLSIPSLNTGLQPPSPSVLSYFDSQKYLGGLTHRLQLGSDISLNTSPGPSVSGRTTNCLLNQTGLLSTENMLPNTLHQQLSLPSSLIASQILLHQQQQRLQQVQLSDPHFSQLQINKFNPYGSPPQLRNKFDLSISMPNQRDHRPKASQKGKQHIRFFNQSSGIDAMKSGNRCPQIRSKYMSSEEIENILNMQNAVSHTNDPYVEDYYHQACLARRTAGRMKHSFCPTAMKDLPSRSRGSNEPQANFQVDAPGRAPFSLVRTPRALLEVDGDDILGQKSSMKPLEQDPMLAARVTIEDGICLLLHVDDIDRLLQFNPPQDGGLQLRRRRQFLLEGLAASFSLVDPLGSVRIAHSNALGPKDDIIFLRIVSLPKGRKLISRYLQLLSPGSDLTRMVCMAIFRHLRFLFGGLSSDLSAANTLANLSDTVSLCVCNMELSAVSACLAAIVCSPEQPPLRSIGSAAGDGATIIVKSVIDRATYLLTDPHTASNYSISNRTLWQASFDAFFGLLMNYCMNKRDSIMQMLVIDEPNDAVIGSKETIAVSKEMPIDLLRASIPHTNEHQRRLLLDFAQRSMPVTSFSEHGTSTRPINSASVPS